MDKHETYERLEIAAANRQSVFDVLRELPIDVVGDILQYVPPEYAQARLALPTMAPEDVQVTWTGAHGSTLLMQSCAVVRALERGFLLYAKRSLDGAKILDYGCGWGRLIRLMYKFTPPENIFGCDPWPEAIESCKSSGLEANLKQCAEVPSAVPFPGHRFDLIYAFSVFTHLSERTARAVLEVCRKATADNGLLAISIRPLSYWEAHDQRLNVVDWEAMKRAHIEKGFAFFPHNREPIEGDITFGDTSISLEYIRENWTEWEVAGVDCLLQDPFQTLVFMRPKT